jgi:hypothetical protein
MPSLRNQAGSRRGCYSEQTKQQKKPGTVLRPLADFAEVLGNAQDLKRKSPVG